MTDAACLRGLRILVVEDVLLLADMICEHLALCRAVVVGPVGRLESALDLAREAALDGAILDINLRGEFSFDVAAALAARAVPYFFVTGYDAETILPPAYRDRPRLSKPFHLNDLTRVAVRCFCRTDAALKTAPPA